jgi:hypothetical protein
VTEYNSEFEGNWRHKLDATRAKYLTIYSDSKGYINTYNYQTGELLEETKDHKWRHKKGILYFNWPVAEKFNVIQEPTFASDIVIIGLDTAYLGQRYMILDGELYTRD